MSAELISLTPATFDVCVLGHPLVDVEAVAELMAVDGHRVTNVIDAELCVLINPDDHHWRAVRDRSMPVVLLYERPLTDIELVEALRWGAAVVSSLSIPVEELSGALQIAGQGQVSLDSHQSAVVVRALRAQDRLGAITLTEREADILHLVEEGNSVKQTARLLGISPKTVENTQRHLFQKLGVRNRSQAVARAHSLGLLDMRTVG